LDTVVYEITHGSPDKGATVVDFIPQKTLYSDIAEPIVVVETSNRSIEGSVDWAAAYAVVARGNIQGAASSESRVEYRKLPPQKALVTSGRIDRGSGVFFKMNGSNYTTLEGQEEFSVLFSVPGNWRAGAVTVRCEADGYQRRVLLPDRGVTCGLGEFGVGLHLEGNAAAELDGTKPATTATGGTWDFLAKHSAIAAWLIEVQGVSLTQPQRTGAMNAVLMDTLRDKAAPETQLPVAVLNKLNDVREAREALEALSH